MLSQFLNLASGLSILLTFQKQALKIYLVVLHINSCLYLLFIISSFYFPSFPFLELFLVWLTLTFQALTLKQKQMH